MAADQDRSLATERDLAHDRFADFERGVLQDNITLCDTKAGLLLAFTGAMVLFSIETLVAIKGAGGNGHWLTLALRASLVLALVGFLASAQFSLTTVLPRILRGRADHIFWASPVYLLPVDDYLAAMDALDPAVERADKYRHLHLLAGICRRKFDHFRLAMRLAQAAFVCLAAAELLRVFG